MAWPPDVADDVDVIAAAHINAIKNSVKLWPGAVDGGANPLSNVTAISLTDSLTITKQVAGLGPLVHFNNPDGNIGSGGEIRHTAGIMRGRMKMLVGEAPNFGTEYVFESLGIQTARIRSANLGMDLSSGLGAGSGISPVFNLLNGATNVGDGVEIRHTAGSNRGALQMVIGDSPFGTDFIFVSNGVTRLRINSNGRIASMGTPTSSAGLTSGEWWHDLTTNAMRRVP